MSTILAIDAIDVEFEIICECGNYYQYGRCPSDVCEILRAHNYREDEELHALFNKGDTENAVERINRNIKGRKEK
jgi:hypothetical protein